MAEGNFSGVGFVDIKRFVKALRKYYVILPRSFATKDFEAGDAFTEDIQKTGIEIKF